MANKESVIYLKFLKDNLPLFITCLFLGLAVGYGHFSLKSPKFKTAGFYEFSYHENNIQSKITESDQAVAVLRSKALQTQLAVDDTNTILIFKPGPVSLSLEVISSTQEEAKSALGKLSDYLTSHFQVTMLGAVLTTQFKSPLYIFLLIWVFISLLFGVIIALIKAYFKNF